MVECHQVNLLEYIFQVLVLYYSISIVPLLNYISVIRSSLFYRLFSYKTYDEFLKTRGGR